MLRRAMFVGLGASIVLACSGGSSNGNTAASATSFIQQYCQTLAPCCAKANKPADGKVCEAFFNAFTGSEQYDPVKGQQCLDAARAASNNPDFCTNSGSDPACKGVYTKTGGTKAPGEPCTQDGDCTPSTDGGTVSCFVTFDSKGGETRICQDQIDGKAGDTPCVGTRNGSSTSYSFGTSTNGTPPPPPARGFVCDVAKNIYCNGTTSTCTAIADVGQVCDTSNSTYACVKTAYCDFTTKKCVARIPIGGDCTSFSTSCADKAYCDSTTKKCAATLADGAPCDSSQQCGSNSCVNKACAATGSGDLGLALLCGN